MNRVEVVAAVILRGEKVLLVVSKKHGETVTPGGRVEPGETHEAAIRREVREETGLTVTGVGRCLGMEQRGAFSVHFYAAEVASGEPVAGDDAASVRWGEARETKDCAWVLEAMVALRTRERDHAVAKAQQFARVLAGAATVEDAVQLLSAALVEDAAGAPNCTEWRGSYSGREFAITVQWVDGKSPHALIDEARRERDAARAQLDAATAALDSERLRTVAAPSTPHAMDALVPLASKAYRRCVGGIEPVDAPVTRATGGARDRPHLCLARHLSEDDARPWQAWLAGCDESLVTGATGDDHATADAALADLREALEQAAEPPPVRWGDEGTMDHDADDDTEGDRG